MRVLPLLPTWINGRAALLGDAAHATVPLLGQGAAMAVEGAGALGCLFPAGTTRDDVQVRLQAYQNLRKDRGEFVNINSVEQVSRIVNGGIHFARSQEMQSYLLEYDVIEAARRCYEESFRSEIQVDVERG
ncbi:hypothetical protein B0H16DRAFT_291717 [Mycena metata]|uniref:FAD-binding domain-containing protein n=1 Tax=Mycena metata TaxID=1033252 RepID=A0AAD7KGI2_9AGAR|nr:hypothetical protein B0H16DRAFT_291717 [Mycena metata]